MMKGSVLLALAAMMSMGETQGYAQPQGIILLNLATLYTTGSAATTNASVCGAHENLVGHNCECKRGYIRYRGQCTRCPPDSRFNCTTKTCKCDLNKVWDIDTNTCRQTCGNFQVFTPNGCQCQTGYKNWNGNCVQDCPAFSTWNATRQTCDCNAGYEWLGTQCQLAYVSPNQNSNQYGTQNQNGNQYGNQNNNQYGNQNNNQYGNQNQQGGYNAALYCGANTRIVPGGTCDCILGFARLNGIDCQRCPDNGHFEPSANNGNGACVCNFAFRLENNLCVPNCGVNERFTPGGGCDCNLGFNRYDGVNCIRQCPTSSWWDTANKRCQCQYGYVLNNNQCVVQNAQTTSTTTTSYN